MDGLKSVAQTVAGWTFGIGVGIVALVVLGLGVWALVAVLSALTPLLHTLLGFAFRILMILIGCVCLYQGYDGFRSGLTGTQSRASKAVDDPTSTSNRIAGIFAGVMMWAIAVSAFFGAWVFNY